MATITVRLIGGDSTPLEEGTTTDPLEAEQWIAQMGRNAIVVDDERFDGPGTLYSGRIEWEVSL